MLLAIKFEVLYYMKKFLVILNVNVTSSSRKQKSKISKNPFERHFTTALSEKQNFIKTTNRLKTSLKEISFHFCIDFQLFILFCCTEVYFIVILPETVTTTTPTGTTAAATTTTTVARTRKKMMWTVLRNANASIN